MKQTILTILISLCGLHVFAANTVTFSISDGIDNPSVKSKMEKVVSGILTEANAAHEAGREMNEGTEKVLEDFR